MPSGTERYYSFDFANIHFVCLDSMTSARTTGSPMLNWLEADLAANTNEWIIAFWHHPPYSKGSHDSDVDIQLIEMRENVVPILEAAGVDLVLCGHSHAYERSFLINGHYGNSATFTEAMKINGSNGRGKAAYRKPVTSPSANQGTVYVVAGSSGQTGFGSFDHPAMFISRPRLGSVVLDITGNQLDATFLRQTGRINDTFTILKDIPNVPPSITLAEPQEGVVFNELDPVPIRADAVDPDGTIMDVDFFVDDILLGTSTNAPYTVTWTNSTLGSHSVAAVAIDNLGSRTATTPVTISVNMPSPAAASGLTATAVSSSQIDLVWNDNASNEQGFRIRRSTNGQIFATIDSVATNVTSYSDTTCPPGMKAFYRVRSFNQSGWAADSNTATATTPP
jgi:hypothetical protein